MKDRAQDIINKMDEAANSARTNAWNHKGKLAIQVRLENLYRMGFKIDKLCICNGQWWAEGGDIITLSDEQESHTYRMRDIDDFILFCNPDARCNEGGHDWEPVKKGEVDCDLFWENILGINAIMNWACDYFIDEIEGVSRETKEEV